MTSPDTAGTATPDAVSPGTAHPAPSADPAAAPEVTAAGALVWRPTRHGVEVLLVHRPRYGDWSWPKGKPEPGEPAPECATREVREETGYRVALGRPLPPVRYVLPDGRLKEVALWAARTRDHTPARARAARPGRDGLPEVDRVEWVTLDEAARRLTYPQDTEPLATLARFAADDSLATTTQVVIRHATARPRDAWARADADRPLVASGRRQALALSALLAAWHPDLVITSPWRRCLETVAPYAAATGARVREKGGLTEAAHRRDPGKAVRHTRRLLEEGGCTALCTHRPVLASVTATLRRACTPAVADLVPTENPYLHPGEVLVLHVLRRTGHHLGHRAAALPVVVDVERFRPRR